MSPIPDPFVQNGSSDTTLPDFETMAIIANIATGQDWQTSSDFTFDENSSTKENKRERDNIIDIEHNENEKKQRTTNSAPALSSMVVEGKDLIIDAIQQYYCSTVEEARGTKEFIQTVGYGFSLSNMYISGIQDAIEFTNIYDSDNIEWFTSHIQAPLAADQVKMRQESYVLSLDTCERKFSLEQYVVGYFLSLINSPFEKRDKPSFFYTDPLLRFVYKHQTPSKNTGELFSAKHIYVFISEFGRNMHRCSIFIWSINAMVNQIMALLKLNQPIAKQKMTLILQKICILRDEYLAIMKFHLESFNYLMNVCTWVNYESFQQNEYNKVILHPETKSVFNYCFFFFSSTDMRQAFVFDTILPIVSSLVNNEYNGNFEKIDKTYKDIQAKADELDKYKKLDFTYLYR